MIIYEGAIITNMSKNSFKCFLFIFFVVFFVGCFIWIIKVAKKNEDWSYISINGYSFMIPRRMYDEYKDDIYIKDHMFLVNNKKGNYIIYASFFNELNMDDIDYGLIKSLPEDDSLKAFDDISELINALSDYTDVVKIVKNIGKTDKEPVYSKYFLETEAGGEFDGYQAYIVGFKKKYFRIIEIILYKKEYELTEYEKKEILGSLNGNGLDNSGNFN